jgi:hypothetical protein
LNELVRRLKLSPKMSLLIALSLTTSCTAAGLAQCNLQLKQKLIDYLNLCAKTAETIEEYAVHRLSFIQATDPEFSEA